MYVCVIFWSLWALTLYPQAMADTAGFPLGVCRVAGVGAAIRSVDWSQSERLIAHNDVSSSVCVQVPVVESPRNLSDWRVGAHVAFEVHVHAFVQMRGIQPDAQAQFNDWSVCVNKKLKTKSLNSQWLFHSLDLNSYNNRHQLTTSRCV